MDIAGAKALKERLAQTRAEKAPPASADVSEDAPPVYHWTGVKPETESSPRKDDDAPADRSVALIRRFVPSFR